MKKALLLTILLFSFTLYGQNKLQSSVYEKFDGINWNKTAGVNYEYDNNGNLIKESFYMWNGSSYEIGSRNTLSYNFNNQMIEKTVEIWSDNLNQFSNMEKHECIYDNSNTLVQFIIYYWSGSQWYEYQIQDITYSNSNIAFIEYSYHDGTQWNIEESFTCYYSGNKLIQAIYNVFNGTQWEQVHKNILTHNGNNKIIK